MGKSNSDDGIDERQHLQRLATLGTLAASSAHELNNVITQLLASLKQGWEAMRLEFGGPPVSHPDRLGR